MTACWRLVAAFVASMVLSIETATLICIPLGLGPNWWIAACVASGPFWAWLVDRAIDKTEAARKQLHGAPRAARDGDGPTLLALFAMHEGPVRLFNVVIVLSPEPDAPSWLHPLRRWNVMIAWVRRNADLEAEVHGLSDAGLLQCTERARVWNDASLYEITGLGRDVAARKAEVLMAGRTEERA